MRAWIRGPWILRPRILRLRTGCRLWLAAVALALTIPSVSAQIGPAERVFPQSKATVEKALKTLTGSMSGHLPVLDGFAETADHPLERYQRGFYQATAEVSATATGGSLVHIAVKVTAWYNDPVASHSGYQLLPSNGRLESDLLDQLADRLAKSEPVARGANETSTSAAPIAAVKSSTARSSATTPDAEARKASPTPSVPDVKGPISSSMNQSLAEQERASRQIAEQPNADKRNNTLQAEVESLEEILKNQGHPKNLVAVKKSGTPVVATPSLTAKPEFLASMHDEFEMLDFNRDWVHVRISGLSRGWIWRDSVEMPDGIPDTDIPTAAAQLPAADMFHVEREETAQFPGDWAPLRGKNVKIISVQKVDENSKDAGPKQRLEYAKSLLDKGYTELAQKPQEWAGMVVIFDSADGGMIAATSEMLQQWKAGTLTDSALWHKCFFDPPETFDTAGPAASQ